LLRLIVVGINSFQTGKGVGCAYTYQGTEETDVPPQHVVFQFQYIPAYHRMNSTPTNAGGYRDSEMRKYLTDLADIEGRGSFLAGLKNAGVPDGVLWAPSRMVSDKQNGPVLIKDKLWLPTVREIIGSSTTYNNYSMLDHETVGNQAWLEYYASYSQRKYNASGSVGSWWQASATRASSFCHIYNNTGDDSTNVLSAFGCVPAFCIW
jgi:hypothetical protein